MITLVHLHQAQGPLCLILRKLPKITLFTGHIGTKNRLPLKLSQFEGTDQVHASGLSQNPAWAWGCEKCGLRHTATYAECRSWVDSCLLVNSYLESVPTSHYGGKAVVQQMGIITPVTITVLPESATMRHSPRSSEGRKCSNCCRSHLVICTHTFGHKRTFSTIGIGAVR